MTYSNSLNSLNGKKWSRSQSLMSVVFHAIRQCLDSIVILKFGSELELDNLVQILISCVIIGKWLNLLNLSFLIFKRPFHKVVVSIKLEMNKKSFLAMMMTSITNFIMYLGRHTRGLCLLSITTMMPCENNTKLQWHIKLNIYSLCIKGQLWVSQLSLLILTGITHVPGCHLSVD